MAPHPFAGGHSAGNNGVRRRCQAHHPGRIDHRSATAPTWTDMLIGAAPAHRHAASSARPGPSIRYGNMMVRWSHGGCSPTTGCQGGACAAVSGETLRVSRTQRRHKFRSVFLRRSGAGVPSGPWSRISGGREGGAILPVALI